MNTANLRAVMAQVGLRVDRLTLRYADGGRTQVIEADGHHPDGKPFAVTTDPFGGSPVERVTQLARDIVAGHRVTTQLAAGADRIAAAAVVARAVVEGRKARMSLAEKFGTLAARAKTVPAALEARADALLPRLDAVEKRGHAAVDGLETVIKDAEAAAQATEDAVRQISNAPFGPSGD